MDFRHLQQFVVLAETLNFRRAAEKLHMSQPPLSVSIRKLEAELGVALFTRGKEGVSLTKSGEAALADARRALFHAREFGQAARAALTGDGGVLRIGFVGSATHAILPSILSQFRTRYPGVQLVLREATSIRIMESLEDETLDVGVVRIPVSARSGIRMSPLQTEPFVLAVPCHHPLATQATVCLRDLSEEGFILYTASDAAGLRMAATQACQLRGFSPKVAQEAVQVQTVIGLVGAGLGIALVPSVNQGLQRDNVVWKTLADFPESASIGIALGWQQGSESAAVRNFVEVAREVFDVQ